MARSPDLQPLLLKGGIAVLVLAAVGYGAKSWLDSRARDQEVQKLIQEAADLREFESDTTGARSKLDEALKLDPRAWRAHFEMGQLLRDLSRDGDAVRAFEKATELAPEEEQPAIHLLLGKTYRAQLRATGKKTHYNNARISFGQAQADPSHAAEALYLVAMLEIEARKALGNEEMCLRRALEALEKLGKEHPDFDEIDVEERAATLRELIERAVEQRQKRQG